jgi:hypothetical protein
MAILLVECHFRRFECYTLQLFDRVRNHCTQHPLAALPNDEDFDNLVSVHAAFEGMLS